MKIIFSGPECSGKTTLATWLSSLVNIPMVSEIARKMMEKEEITTYDTNFVDRVGEEYLLKFRKHQEDPMNLILDTDILNVIIWKIISFEVCDIQLWRAWEQGKDTFTFLCTPDFPWEYDALRESEFRQWEIFVTYQSMLNYAKKPYLVVNGNISKRKMQVIESLQQLQLISTL